MSSFFSNVVTLLKIATYYAYICQVRLIHKIVHINITMIIFLEGLLHPSLPTLQFSCL